MPTLVTPLPGFAAFTSAVPGHARALAEQACEPLGGDLLGLVDMVDLDERSTAVVWSLPRPDLSTPWQLVLGAMARTDRGELDAHDVRRLVAGGPGDEELLADVMPPFAAAGWDPVARVVGGVTDWLGFRHLYLAQGPGWSGLSSSASALAGAVDAGLDPTSLMVQSLLGWQTGERSLFTGVRKLAPGSRVRLQAGHLVESVVVARSVRPEPRSDSRPEQGAAAVVAEVTGHFLDDHDDALLQLTGGLDSRILLGSIPRDRRRRVEALTLAVPGSPDLEIAARLAAAEGMRHRVIDLRGLEDLPIADAVDLVAASSRRVEGSADPLALAALAWAERGLAGQPRLAGLGGEVARGFYYFLPQLRLPVRPRLSAALARWRMFPNEAVQRDALLPEFHEAAADAAVAEVHRRLRAGGESWWPATDEFYLWQRMQRWAGTLASATAFDRSTLNPMLSRRFVDLARELDPLAKRNMRHLSRICLEADATLADVRLDGRPAPRTYAEHSWANTWRLGRTQAGKVVRKAAQRVSRASRPPAGGEIMAAKVLEHWRAVPSELERLLPSGVFRPEWLDRVAAGQAAPTPSTVALMVNILEATRGAAQLGTRESREPASAGRVLGRSSARMAERD